MTKSINNAYNAQLDSTTHPANIILAGVGISTLWCPSDPTAATIVNLAAMSSSFGTTVGGANGYVLPPGQWNQRTTSYRGSCGVYSDSGVTPYGIISVGSMDLGISINPPIVSIAAITDGTSNTVIFTESTSAWVAQTGQNATALAVYTPGWNLGTGGTVADAR